MKSDSQLKQEVEDELMSNAAADANGIGVAVVNGNVRRVRALSAAAGTRPAR